MRTAQSYDYSQHSVLSQILRGLFSQYYVSLHNSYEPSEWYPLFQADAYRKADQFGLDKELTDYHHLHDFEFIDFARSLLNGTASALPEVVLVSNTDMQVIIELTGSEQPDQNEVEGLINLFIRGREPDEDLLS